MDMEYKFSNRISGLHPSAIREILKAASDPSVISFAAGNPAPESFPVEDIKRLSAQIYQDCAVTALQYGISEGYTPLRDAMKKRMADVYSCGREFDELVIVSGAQQGIELTCKALCNEGDTVICENPSFIGALNAFRSYNVNLVGIDMEDDGLNIEQLEQTLKTAKNVKLIYLIPTFQNPTGAVMSLEKRHAVYRLAKQYGAVILEDSPYMDLRFAGQELPAIKSFDDEGIVVFCGSFSKILSAGIRVGYVLAPKALIAKIVVGKQVSDVHTNMFFQILAHRFVTECDLNAHILKIRDIYRHKSALMLDGVKKYIPNAKLVPPQGGLFLWFTLPETVNALEYCKKAAENGVAVVPGAAFMANEGEPCNSIRLNYSTPTDDKIVEGMKKLGNINI